jgi:hypothetical protein
MKFFFLFLFSIILIISCNTKLDGTTLETLRISVEEMKKSLSETEQNRLDYFINNKTSGFLQLLTYKDHLKYLDGKTYDELEELYGDSLNNECNQKIPEIERQINLINLSKKAMDSVSIFNSNASSYVGRYSIMNQNILSFEVKNKCSEGLKTIYFKIYFIDESNNDTLINDRGNYTFDYPLKGSKKISVSPGLFSDLDSKMNPKLISATKFKMEVEGIKTKSYEFNNYVKEELQELENELLKYKSYLTD